MNRARVRTIVMVLLAGAIGVIIGSQLSTSKPLPAQTTEVTPTAGSIRVLYSLDKKQNDKELISLIDNAHKYIYFAIYEFTLHDVADALVRAKERGVTVRGIVDRENSTISYEAPIIKELTAVGIPIETQIHPTGIMHIKALVTENAYASGSYNWTNSATTINDEVLEIGTDKAMRNVYENILKQLLTTNIDGTIGAQKHSTQTAVTSGTIDYTAASKHIGQKASIRGAVIDVYTSRSGTTFFDYCVSYGACPFSAVIFASNKPKFGSLTRYQGKMITVSGTLTSYKGRAEMVLSSPTQIHE